MIADAKKSRTLQMFCYMPKCFYFLSLVTYVYPRVDDPYDPLMPTRLSGDQPSSLCTCIETTPGSGNGNEGNGAVAAHDASQKLIHANAPRLAFYEEESNMGKGFIKVQKAGLEMCVCMYESVEVDSIF